jgi:hypothetical protein
LIWKTPRGLHVIFLDFKRVSRTGVLNAGKNRIAAERKEDHQ